MDSELLLMRTLHLYHLRIGATVRIEEPPTGPGSNLFDLVSLIGHQKGVLNYLSAESQTLPEERTCRVGERCRDSGNLTDEGQFIRPNGGLAEQPEPSLGESHPRSESSGRPTAESRKGTHAHRYLR